MRYHLYPIDNPDYYIRLKKSELEALKFKSRVARLVGLGFFVALFLMAGENVYVAGFGAFVFLLTFAGTMMLIQDKLAEIGYYQSMTYAGRQDFNALIQEHRHDPEVARFDQAIKAKNREPLVAELIRLRTYLKAKESEKNHSEGFGPFKVC